MQHDITNTAVFRPLEEHIRRGSYTDADLFAFIAEFASTRPEVASAVCLHARDILNEFSDADMSYTDIVVHVYWRTFFSPEHAGKYKTDFMVHDQPALAQFVQFLTKPSSTVVTPDLFSDVTHSTH